MAVESTHVPRALVVEEGRIVVAASGTERSSGIIVSLAAGDSRNLTTITEQVDFADSPSCLVSDGTSVYWLSQMNRKNGNVGRHAEPEQDVVLGRTLTSFPKHLICFNQRVCWVESFRNAIPVHQLPLGFQHGARSREFTSTYADGFVMAMTCNSTRVFCAVSCAFGHILEITRTGVASTFLPHVDPEDDTAGIGLMTANEQVLVFSSLGVDGGRIFARSLTSGRLRRVAQTEGAIGGLLLDADHIYWSETEQNRIRRAALVESLVLP